MRYRELNEARPWKSYQGRTHRCIIASPEDLGNGRCLVEEVVANFGTVHTGKAEVFFGYYVRIVSAGEEWLGEDRHSLIAALRHADEAAQHSGWSIIALGCTPQFRESSLSSNSGYGSHPAHPDRHVHLFEPIPRQRDAD